ncbi:delta-like protein 4 [Mya arenaria]|uniref:delta-like protein 4 n=1 Tax=Mya arenaria TaxID=6604 RepID=UPI0022E1534B|nr:delta-like protein 4 [Mya arenaria]
MLSVTIASICLGFGLWTQAHAEHCVDVYDCHHTICSGDNQRGACVHHACTCEDPCLPSPCSHEECSRTNVYPFYHCTGVCESSPCQHGGSCVRTNSGRQYQCQCATGFTGTNCESRLDTHPCLAHPGPCEAHQTCLTTHLFPYYQCQVTGFH